MRIKFLVAALFVVLAAGVAEAGFFELMFNDETADVWGGFQLGKDDDAGFLIGGRYLYSDEDNIDASVPAVLAAFSGSPEANREVDFQLGMQYYLGEAADQDVEGLAIGGAGNWAPSNWKGVFVGARLFYVPDVFSTGDTDGLVEWAVRAGYAINPKIRVFLEYTNISVDLESGAEVDVVDSAVFGFGFRF